MIKQKNKSNKGFTRKNKIQSLEMEEHTKRKRQDSTESTPETDMIAPLRDLYLACVKWIESGNTDHITLRRRRLEESLFMQIKCGMCEETQKYMLTCECQQIAYCPGCSPDHMVETFKGCTCTGIPLLLTITEPENK